MSNVFTNDEAKQPETWMSCDVGGHQQCSVQSLIGMLLSKCLVGGEDKWGFRMANIVLFNYFRKLVLSACKTELDKASSPVVVNLKKYKTATGIDKYPFLVRAGNEALKMLKSVDIEDVRPADDELGILFHLWGPVGFRRAQESGPTIIITSLRSALRAADRQMASGDWETITKSFAPNPPIKHFEWFDVFSSLELESQAGGVDEEQSDDDYASSDEKVPLVLRSREYAFEMHHGSFGVSRSINLCIVDNVAWVWYYDRQGCIQSEGIDFLRDFPSFLVLLFAFQHLTLEQWGLNPRLDDRIKRAHLGMFDRDSEGVHVPTEWLVKIGSTEVKLLAGNTIYTSGFTGRGTVVIEARSIVDNPPKRLVVKVYWPDEVRANEAIIIYKAKHAAKGDTGILGHLPQVIDHEDFEFRTGRVRYSQNLEGSRHQSQVMRVIIFGYLEPIITLQHEHFVRAWLETVVCHYKMWELGFQHGDPSLANLMIHPETKHGVLNDWDLSSVRPDSEASALMETRA